MKPKNFSKKLILNKKTIAHLNNKKMNDVLGGGTMGYCTVEDPTCVHCFPERTDNTFCPVNSDPDICQ